MPHELVIDTEADTAAAGVPFADWLAPAAGTTPTPLEAPAAASQRPASASSSYATAQLSSSATGPVPADVSIAVGAPPGEGGERAVDPRWSGNLAPRDVGGTDYDALRIANGNKVSRVYADAGDPPDAPDNLDDADDVASM